MTSGWGDMNFWIREFWFNSLLSLKRGTAFEKSSWTMKLLKEMINYHLTIKLEALTITPNHRWLPFCVFSMFDRCKYPRWTEFDSVLTLWTFYAFAVELRGTMTNKPCQLTKRILRNLDCRRWKEMNSKKHI